MDELESAFRATGASHLEATMEYLAAVMGREPTLREVDAVWSQWLRDVADAYYGPGSKEV